MIGELLEDLSEGESYSDYWLNHELVNQYIPDEKKGTKGATFSIDLIKLASYRKVISNFVTLLTNKDIPVKFLSNSDQNFSDGKTVWISSKIKQKSDFDWSVGLALHEGSHVLLSDFSLVPLIFIKVPLNLMTKCKDKNLTNEQIIYLCKWVFNIVEDRYIDSFIFREAPGYRGYYKSLYNKFWNNEMVGRVLKSKMFRITTLKSYEYRICYFTNPNTDLDALPDLKTIAELLDISNIYRLKTTDERLNMSYSIVEIIIDNLGLQPKVDSTISSKETIKTVSVVLGGGESFEKFFGDKEEKDDKRKEELEKIEEPEETEDNCEEPLIEDDPSNEDGNTNEFSKQELKKINNSLEEIRSILKHDYNNIKEKLSDEERGIIEVVDKFGIVLSPAGFGLVQSGDYTQAAVDCIVVERLTKELIESGKKIFPMASVEHAPGNEFKPPQSYEDAIVKGFTLGKLLGRRLQVRGETNITKFIRKRSGKITRRLLADIGTGLTDIFYKTHIQKYNRARLHISIDASSSMNSDTKWLPTMTCVSAVCVAASMVNNLSISVSFRSTIRISDGKELPYIVLAYDSDVDKIQKVRNLFPYLSPCGCTPEGLAFEAIMDKFIIGKRKDGQDHYFLNISDGEPCYSLSADENKHRISFEYIGDVATLHTKRQVEKIRSQGVNVLSYFIKSDLNLLGSFYQTTNKNDEDKLKIQFQKMYGKNSQFIDVTNVGNIANTMNRLFLSHD